MTNLTPSIPPSRLLQLPAELRLKIYEYVWDVECIFVDLETEFGWELEKPGWWY
jgi:hypothetical protein